jgi:hypothetical protein
MKYLFLIVGLLIAISFLCGYGCKPQNKKDGKTVYGKAIYGKSQYERVK